MKRRTKKAIAAAVAVGSIVTISYGCGRIYLGSYLNQQFMYGPPPSEDLLIKRADDTNKAQTRENVTDETQD